MSFKIHWIKEKKNAQKKGIKLVYEEQEKVGQEIVRMFDRRVLVTLCAPPQWGKTGVSLYVSYHMCLRGINPQNVFFITGMSDRSWLDQTRERVGWLSRYDSNSHDSLRRLCSSKSNRLTMIDMLKQPSPVLRSRHLS